MHRILTIVLALLLPALVIGYVAFNPPADNPYDLPQTLVPEGLFPTTPFTAAPTSVEVRSEAVVPTAAFTRVVIASSDAAAAETAAAAVRDLGYPSVITTVVAPTGSAVYHRAGFEGEAATIAAALGLPVGPVQLSGRVTDVDDDGDVIVVVG